MTAKFPDTTHIKSQYKNVHHLQSTLDACMNIFFYFFTTDSTLAFLFINFNCILQIDLKLRAVSYVVYVWGYILKYTYFYTDCLTLSIPHVRGESTIVLMR